MKNISIFLIITSLTCCIYNNKPFKETQANINTKNISNPLILGGRPYIDPDGKAYANDEATLINEYLIIDFNEDLIYRWYDLYGIEQLVNLKRLWVIGNNLDGIDFTPVSSLQNLEKLYIRGNITSLPELSNLFKLIELNIKDSHLVNLEGIGAPNLNKIKIDKNNRYITSLAPINNLIYLEELYIHQSIFTDNDISLNIADLTNLPNLRILNLQVTDTKINLQGIENLTSLEIIEIENETYNMSGIGQLNNLKDLNLRLYSPEPSIEFLRNIQNLQFLRLYSRHYFNSEAEADQILDLSPLSTVNSLRFLGCEKFIIKNIASLDVLEYLTSEYPRYINLSRGRLLNENDISRHHLVFDFGGK